MSRKFSKEQAAELVLRYVMLDARGDWVSHGTLLEATGNPFNLTRQQVSAIFNKRMPDASYHGACVAERITNPDFLERYKHNTFKTRSTSRHTKKSQPGQRLEASERYRELIPKIVSAAKQLIAGGERPDSQRALLRMTLASLGRKEDIAGLHLAINNRRPSSALNRKGAATSQIISDTQFWPLWDQCSSKPAKRPVVFEDEPVASAVQQAQNTTYLLPGTLQAMEDVLWQNDQLRDLENYLLDEFAEKENELVRLREEVKELRASVARAGEQVGLETAIKQRAQKGFLGTAKIQDGDIRSAIIGNGWIFERTTGDNHYLFQHPRYGQLKVGHHLNNVAKENILHALRTGTRHYKAVLKQDND